MTYSPLLRSPRSPRSPRWLTVLGLLLLALVLRAQRAEAEPLPPELVMRPTPSWVTPPPPESTPVRADARGAVEVLQDVQVHVGSTFELYRHREWQIVSASGLEAVGEQEIAFDPGFEHVMLHALRIQRGGTTLDALAAASIRVAQRERGAAERQYDDERTIVVILSDLRMGDRLTVEYTVEGRNPVFEGKLAWGWYLASGHPIDTMRVRIDTALDRPLSTRLYGLPATAATTHDAEGRRIFEIVRHDVAPWDEDDHTPAWFDRRPSVDASEYPDWASVVQWALPIYESASALTPEIEAKIAELRAAATTPEERARLAVRFVQDDVRYLGLELGPHSHRPHSAAAVLQQRFGDCKDKVTLLVALLRGLGIPAHAALTLASAGQRPSATLPGPFAFDHVIVRARLQEHDVWIDATRTGEHGPIGATNVSLDEALVLAPDTTQVAQIPNPEPTEPTREADETFHAPSPATPGLVALDVVTVLRGEEALRMRLRLADEGRAELSETYARYYAKTYPGSTVASPLVVVDDPNADRVEIREFYTVPIPADAELVVHGAAIESIFDAPRVRQRTAPLAVPERVFVRDRVHVEWLTEVPAAASLAVASFSFSRTAERSHDRTTVTFELRTRTDHIAAADTAGYLASVDQVDDAASVPLRRPVTSTAETVFVWFGAIALGAIALGGLYALGSTLAARVRRPARSASRAAVSRVPGETAAECIELASEAAARAHVDGSRCRCGAPLTGVIASLSRVRLGDSTLTVVRASCPSCEAATVRYFRVAGAP